MHSDYFQPEKLIAVGPAAKVYRGVETATGRKVLIKALLADQEATHLLDRERLQMLAPSLMQIRHPQIAGLITLLPTEDEFALVYDFMPGISGRALPQEKKLTADDVRALAVQLMNALLVGEHLRQPHGDLKPSNLIITDHPGGGLFLQVQDWGLTLARAAPSPETLWFRAPELLQGGQPSSQSDLFTAASSLFFLATGAAPAQGNTPEEILADFITFDLRGSLAVMRPDMDQSFGEWLAWLLTAAPNQRPTSVAHALDALMRSMQTSFVYQPQHAPQMAAGAATGMLVAGSTARAMPRPAAPRPPSSSVPKARTPQPATTAAAATLPLTPAPKKKRLSPKIVFAIALNLGVLAGLLWFFSPLADQGGWRKWFSQMNDVVQASDQNAAKEETKATATEGKGIKGRYIRIEMKGKGIISMAEVQVFSGTENIANQGTASQSTMLTDGAAERAIDGNTDGDSKNNSITQTHFNDKDPHWQLDLGHELSLNTIIIWNRTDKEENIERLKNFTVSVLDSQQKVVWEKQIDEVPKPSRKLMLGE